MDTQKSKSTEDLPSTSLLHGDTTLMFPRNLTSRDGMERKTIITVRTDGNETKKIKCVGQITSLLFSFHSFTVFKYYFIISGGK